MIFNEWLLAERVKFGFLKDYAIRGNRFFFGTFCRPGKALIKLRYKMPSTCARFMLFLQEPALILATLRLIMRQPNEAPQQHKQPSRKGKKAWRKNVDVTDVQVGLDEAREEVINGLVPSIVHTSGYRARLNTITVVSLPKSLLIPSLPSTLKARKPYKNLTTKPTRPSKRTISLLNALLYHP